MSKRGNQIVFNFSNRVLYTLIAIFLLLIVGVGIWATSHPNPGHSVGEVNHPSIISDGILSWGEIDFAGTTGFSDGIDAYNSAFDTEAEIDAAVSNNGYSTGAHTTDSGKITGWGRDGENCNSDGDSCSDFCTPGGGVAFCSGNNIACPAGTTKILTGVNSRGWDTTAYYLCIVN